MSFFDSLFNSNKAPTAPTAPAEASPANAASSTTESAAAANMNGSNTQENLTQLYAKMWENNPKGAEDTAPTFNLDPAVLDKVSSSLSFTSKAPPELLAKAQSGDIPSMMQLMDWTSQQAYKTAMQHQSALTDNFVGQREQFSQKGLGKAVQQELTMNSLFANDAGAALPDYAKKQFSDVAKRYAEANPDAAPHDVAAATKKYFQDMAALANGSSTPAQQKAPQPSVDWDNWDNN